MKLTKYHYHTLVIKDMSQMMEFKRQLIFLKIVSQVVILQSSNINEVNRVILNLFFLQKEFTCIKGTKGTKMQPSTGIKAIKKHRNVNKRISNFFKCIKTLLFFYFCLLICILFFLCVQNLFVKKAQIDTIYAISKNVRNTQGRVLLLESCML